MSHDDAGDFPPASAKKKSPAEKEAEKWRKKLTPGSLMKAVIRSGSGDATPAEGDQVVLHCTTRTMDGIVVNSTRREHGGKGVPLRFVLGKSKMILGFAEGFPTMLKGEIAMFKMKPQIHYAEDDCPVTAPDGFPKDDELQFEIEMLDFFKAKVVAEDLGVVKKGDGCYMGEEQLERGDGYYMSSRIGNNKVVCKVSMDSLHLVHVKLLAADLLSLTARHTSPPSFVRCGRTVARAELVGVVVSRDHREKFLRFLVDDGTGSVPCVLWLNHQYINANSSSGTLDSDPTAEMALKMSEVVRLGTLLRVRGRIVMYRGAIQIAVRDVVLEKDPNVEVLHWLQCVRMAKECYDLPPPSA